MVVKKTVKKKAAPKKRPQASKHKPVTLNGLDVYIIEHSLSTIMDAFNFAEKKPDMARKVTAIAICKISAVVGIISKESAAALIKESAEEVRNSLMDTLADTMAELFKRFMDRQKSDEEKIDPNKVTMN